MFAKTTPAAVVLATAALLATGCATSPSTGHTRYPSATVTMPVRVSNESPEMVQVWFISHSGYKVRVGSVPPYTSATFSPAIVTSMSGRFYVRRLSEEAVTAMMGELEPFSLGNRAVTLRVASSAIFDSWQLW